MQKPKSPPSPIKKFARPTFRASLLHVCRGLQGLKKILRCHLPEGFQLLLHQGFVVVRRDLSVVGRQRRVVRRRRRRRFLGQSQLELTDDFIASAKFLQSFSNFKFLLAEPELDCCLQIPGLGGFFSYSLNKFGVHIGFNVAE